jgi:DNA replication licensing factor MCM5
MLTLNHGFGGASIPRICDNQRNPGPDKASCMMDSYMIVPDKCDYIDQQVLKLQEAPELVPTGEMPRTFVMTCDRYLSDKVTPGNRVKIVGILSVINRKETSASAHRQVKSTVRTNYIRVVGIQSEVNKDASAGVTGFALPNITSISF